MKSFFKKIALVLTLALVIGLVPANTASAAATPGLKYASKILYVNGDASGKYEDWCWTPSQNTTGYDVAYEVKSGKDLITVAKNGKITVTGEGVGKAVVGVTYTSKTSGASKTADFTVYVKQNANLVKFMQATEKVLAEVLTAGDVVNTQVAKTAGSKFVKGEFGTNNWTGIITDLVKITSSDEKVIKVDGFKLEAVGGGTAIITVETYQKESNLVTASKDYSVVVQDEGITSIKQVSVTELNVFSGVELTEGVKAENFVIKRNSTGQVIAIKEAKVDDNDKKKVIITTFESLNDGADYTLTYGEKDYTFKVTDNKVANIIVNPTQIAYQVATEIKANLVDANGVILNSATLSNRPDALEFNIETTQGYMDGDKLTLFEKGNTAKVKVTYHTYDYDEFGVEKSAINVEATIVAVDPSAVTLKDYVYTIAKDTPDFSKTVTSNNKIAVNDTEFKVFFQVKDSTGADVSANYYLDSSNPDVLLVNNQQTLANGISADIFATKTVNGAFVLVKNSDGKVVYSLPVAVLAERKTNSITVDPQGSVVLSNATAADDKKEVAVKRFDQYGTEMSAMAPTVVCLTAPSTAGSKDNVVSSMVTISDGKVVFSGVGQVKGSYVFTVTIEGKSRVINVTIQEPNQSASSVYKLILSTNNLDTVFKSKDDSNKTVDIKVGEYKGGVLAGYVDLTKAEIKVSMNGNDYTGNTAVSGSSVKFTATDTVNVTSGTSLKKVPTGTYSVSVKLDDNKSLNGAFIITDTQTPVTAIRQNQIVSVGNASAEQVLLDGFKFYLNGSELIFNGDKQNARITAWDTNPNTDFPKTNKTYFVKTVTVEVLVDGIYVPITVAVNQSLILR